MYNFHQDAIINLGNEQKTIQVHNNAPFVVNFYTVRSGKKVYNQDLQRMKFTTSPDNWMRDNMNRLHGSSKKVYYNANFEAA